MNIKMAFVACVLAIGANILCAQDSSKASVRKAEDSAAYRTGEKTAELILQQWIQLAKKDIQKVIDLSEQIASASKAYSSQLNKSFLYGNVDCLKKKDVKAIAESQKLDKHGCARVLACYYYWDSLVTAALASGAFDFENPEDKENEALERAATEVYGSASPEIIADLKQSLAADEELTDAHDMIDFDDSSDDDDESSD